MKYILSPEMQNQGKTVSAYTKAVRGNPLSEQGGRNALGIGFRIWVKSKFNHSQQEAINGAAREYGSGGFTLVKGPPGTGKTTTLGKIIKLLHYLWCRISFLIIILRSSSCSCKCIALTAVSKVLF